jgi:hypothetical protein
LNFFTSEVETLIDVSGYFISLLVVFEPSTDGRTIQSFFAINVFAVIGYDSGRVES